jgi:uncharacterized protein (DUF779 family)
MAKISTYVINASPSLSDKLIGTDVDDLSITKNFTLGDIAALIQTYIGVPTLDEVLTSGNSSGIPIDLSTLTPSSINLLSIATVGSNEIAYTNSSGFLDGSSSLTYASNILTAPTVKATTQVWAAGQLKVDGALLDGTASAGTSIKYLRSTGTGVLWSDPYIPTLEEVITEGNSSTLPITLTTLAPSSINLLTVPRVGVNQVAFSDSSGILDGVSTFTYTASTSTLSVTNISATTIGSNDVNVDNELSLQGPLLDVDGLPGTSGQVLKSTGSGVLWDSSVYVPSIITVLNAESTLVGQAPAAVDTPLQVRFDGPESNAYVTLSTLGVITFLQTGVYSVNIQGLFKRLGSSGGTAKVHFRGLLNSMPVGPTQAVDLDVVGVGIPYERSILLEITTAGSTLTFEIVRDSAGVNAGGLYQEITTLPSWGNVPSAAILINKIV